MQSSITGKGEGIWGGRVEIRMIEIPLIIKQLRFLDESYYSQLSVLHSKKYKMANCFL
jgi:hypothetical protein